jgi:hypothetical protein
MIDTERLAALLVSRLRPVLPAPVTIEQRGRSLTIRGEGGGWSGYEFESGRRVGAEDAIEPFLMHEVGELLAQIEDEASESTADRYASDLEVALDQGLLRLWFGVAPNTFEPDDVRRLVPELEPIRLEDIAAPDPESPRVGDVVRISLSGGLYAHGRVLRNPSPFMGKSALGIYREFTTQLQQPMLGGRDYLFTAGIDNVAFDHLPVVAHDPSTTPDEDWPPPWLLSDGAVIDRGFRRPAGPEDAARDGARFENSETLRERIEASDMFPGRSPAPSRVMPDELWVRRPDWEEPPANMLGAPVPLSPVLYKSDALLIAITNIAAYPTGITFDLVLRARHPGLLDEFDSFAHSRSLSSIRYGLGLDEGQFRLGVEFADGRTTTSLDDRPRGGPNPEMSPPGPVLSFTEGGGGDTEMRYSYWLSPVPPPGSLAIFCSWPAHSIDDSRITMEADAIIAAAADAITLWEHPDVQPL